MRDRAAELMKTLQELEQALEQEDPKDYEALLERLNNDLYLPVQPGGAGDICRALRKKVHPYRQGVLEEAAEAYALAPLEELVGRLSAVHREAANLGGLASVWEVRPGLGWGLRQACLEAAESRFPLEARKELGLPAWLEDSSQPMACLGLPSPRETVDLLEELAEKGRKEGLLALDDCIDELPGYLQKPVQLVTDGTPPEKIHRVLRRNFQGLRRSLNGAEELFLGAADSLLAGENPLLLRTACCLAADPVGPEANTGLPAPESLINLFAAMSDLARRKGLPRALAVLETGLHEEDVRRQGGHSEEDAEGQLLEALDQVFREDVSGLSVFFLDGFQGVFKLAGFMTPESVRIEAAGELPQQLRLFFQRTREELDTAEDLLRAGVRRLQQEACPAGYLENFIPRIESPSRQERDFYFSLADPQEPEVSAALPAVFLQCEALQRYQQFSPFHGLPSGLTGTQSGGQPGQAGRFSLSQARAQLQRARSGYLRTLREQETAFQNFLRELEAKEPALEKLWAQRPPGPRELPLLLKPEQRLPLARALARLAAEQTQEEAAFRRRQEQAQAQALEELFPQMTGYQPGRVWEFPEQPGQDPFFSYLKACLPPNSKDYGDFKENLEAVDPSIADELFRSLFLFEDIGLLPQESIRKILREVDIEDLARALQDSPGGAAEIFACLSEGGEALLREEIEALGGSRRRSAGDKEAAEQARRRILDTAFRLEEAGEIQLPRS